MRSQNFYVRFKYDRRLIKEANGDKMRLNCKTTALVFDRDTSTLVCMGESRQSNKDPYDKTYGRKLALSRAFNDGLEIVPKAERSELWEQFRTLKKEPLW